MLVLLNRYQRALGGGEIYILCLRDLYTCSPPRCVFGSFASEMSNVAASTEIYSMSGLSVNWPSSKPRQVDPLGEEKRDLLCLIGLLLPCMIGGRVTDKWPPRRNQG